MPDFSKRSGEEEIMDDLTYADPLMDQTLAELEIINTWLGGNNVTMSGIRALLRGKRGGNKLRIADLGCGRGDMLKRIEKWTRSKALDATLVGVDANAYIVAVARKNLNEYTQIELQCVDIFSPEFEAQRFDIVIGTLFYHHFSNEQLITFFRKLKDHTEIGLIINDIHRHPVAFYAIRFLTQLFSKSSMVKYDAPLSVLRAFTRKELTGILEGAGISNFQIRWKWAFRWQVLVFTSTGS